MTTMSSADAAWLRMDRPTNPMVINALLRFERRLDPAALRELLAERLVDRFPRFRQIPVGDSIRGLRWEDDPRFDLELHVRHLALPDPGDEGALRELVSDLVSDPLDRSRPLWTTTLIDGPGDESAIHVQMHHCIADGIALARVLMTLTDAPDEAAVAPDRPAGDGKGRGLPLPPVVRELAGAAEAAVGAIAHEAVATLLDPGHLATIARTAARDAGIIAKFLASPPDPRHALHDELGIGQRVAWSPALPLPEVRRIAHAFGATINDVLLAAVTGAIGDHLRAAGTPADEIHAMVPFNLRPLDEPLPRDLGNRFGLLLLALPVGLESAVARLLEVHRRTTAIKHSHEGQIAYGILAAMGTTPAAVEARLIEFFSAKATAVITNVPGPREPVSLLGVPMRSVLVWAPSSGSLGMSVSIFSYRGEVTVGFLVNRRLAADPQPLADALPKQLRMLAQATSSPAAR
jgi:WS/DGAT/MGAT family acyltransferase